MSNEDQPKKRRLIVAIIRVIAVDPRPRADSEDDVVVYQVPEKSRALELLEELFTEAGIEWVQMEGPTPKPRKKREPRG
jgi:hypothetical protein